MKNRNVYVIGVFDVFHRGHVEFLKKAKALGERLIIAVNGDRLVSEYKRKPIMTEQDRLEIIKNCKLVDDAFIITEYDNKPYIEKYDINVIVHGSDWERESYLKQIHVTEEYLLDRGVELVFVPYTSGISTSGLIRQMAEKVSQNSNSVDLPTIFQVNENIIHKIPEFVKNSQVHFRKILVVSGNTRSRDYAEIVLNVLNADYYTVVNNDLKTVDELKDYCSVKDFDLLIGVGG